MNAGERMSMSAQFLCTYIASKSRCICRFCRISWNTAKMIATVVAAENQKAKTSPHS